MKPPELVSGQACLATEPFLLDAKPIWRKAVQGW